MIPDEKDLRIAELERENAELRARNAELEKLVVELTAKVAELTAKVAELTERLNRNSSNSSRPPSTDPPWDEGRKKHGGRRKRGGQIGHTRHERPILPPEKVTSRAEHFPTRCHRCNRELPRQPDPTPRRHQTIDLPDAKIECHEDVLHGMHCPFCGAFNRARLPPDVPRSSFGPRVTAAVALMSGCFKVSKRGVQKVLESLFGIHLALGSVAKQEQRVSCAVEPPTVEAVAWVQRQAMANIDETGWREAGARSWLWVMATWQVAVFTIAPSRSRSVLMQLLGKAWTGIVGSDRFLAYAHLGLRQLCWAHLCRDFTAMVERPGQSRAAGRSLLALACWVFRAWHRFRRRSCTRAQLIEQTVPLVDRLPELLLNGMNCGHPKTAATCREIRAVAEHVFTFLYVEGVEPTNNLAERTLRHGVMWRKQSFGTQSSRGSRFVERMLTCNATLRLQGRNPYDFLVQALIAQRSRTPMPSLLPAAP